MARNNRPMIIGAIALGVIALFATLYTLLGGSPPANPNAANVAAQAPAAPTKTQFVAIRDIPPRTPLTPALFRQEAVPENEIPAGAITDLTSLSGMLSKQLIPQGGVATAAMATRSVQRVIDANFPIRPDMRAVAIYVDPVQTAAGLVDVGDHVDVIATHHFALVAAPNTRVEGAGQIATGRVIGQNLVVLAVEKSLAAAAAAPTPVPPPAAGAAGAPAAGGAAAPVPGPTPAPPPGSEVRTRVLLEAPIEVATRLVAAGEEGKLHIVIRNPSSFDHFPVPEAHEYPSHLVALPPTRPAASAAPAASARTVSSSNSDSQGATRRRRSSESLSELNPPAPQLPIPDMHPVPPAQVSSGGLPGPSAPVAPQGPPENEVTVIRGTEKTRVLVPR